MRKLLSTSALIAPFLLGAALAQDAPVTPAPADPPADTQMETDTGTLPDTDADPDGTTEEGLDQVPGTDPVDTDTDTDSTQPDAAPTAVEPATDPATAPATDTAPAVDGAAAPAATIGTQPAGDTIVQQQATSELRVDWITGTTVYSRQDENIGSIRDLIIDQDTNTITAAVLSVGGFLGIGAKQIAVRFDELEIDFDAREIHLDLTREEADAAPEYAFRDRTDAPAPPAAPVSNGMGAPIAPID